MPILKPKLFTTLKDYNKEQFISDITAGIIVGVVALPLSIAFAIASGVAPEKGLITAIIAGFIISFLGGSRVQIGGPTGAFIIIVYGIVHQYGTTGLAVATVMAGVILILMGFARFGALIKFIPYPIVVGFTSGIAVLIFSTQIKDFFGLQIKNIPSEFYEKWIVYFSLIDSTNFYVLGTALVSLLIMIYWPKITHRIPGSIIAILVSTIAVYYLKLPVETIGTKFGEISSSLPHLTLYDINFKIIRNLIAPATVIALLAAIESLLSAVVADGMIGGKHRSNMELIAQGAANIITPLFGGIPATGAIARTATNIKNGGRTPVAGIVHSVTLFLIMIFFGSMASLIPMATLAAILVMVAYNMSEWRAFRQLLKAPKSDIIVLLTTFFLTVIFDLTLALEIGIILSVLLFMKRMAEVSNINILTRELADEEEKPDTNSIDRKQIPEGVEVFEINGPFFFGAASKFESQMQIVESPPKVRILRMRNVPAIDATGLNTIKSIYNHSKKMNTALILSGVHTQPLYAMTQSGIIKLFGYENIFGNIDDALDSSRELLGLPKIGRPKDFIPSVKREIENNN